MRLVSTLSKHLVICSIFAALAFGCGSDSDGGDGGPGSGGASSGTGGGDGSGGSGTGGATSGECAATSDLEEVLAPTELPGGAVVRYLASDGDYVYFSGFRTLFRIPVGGGTHEPLYDAGELSTYIPFFLRDSDLVVLRGTTVLSVPKTGGAPTELATLPDQPYSALDGRVDFLVDGDMAYFKSETGILDDPYETTLYSVDLTDGVSTLLTTTSIGKGSRLAKSGDALYIRGVDPEAPEPADQFEPVPSALYSIPLTGGDPERVTVTFEDTRRFNFVPVGADDTSVFITATALAADDNDFGAAQAGGLFRVPRAGGAATRLAQSFQLFNIQSEHHLIGNRNFFRLADTVERIYSLEGETFEQLLCVDDLVFSITADSQHLYLGISPANSDVSTIVRSPL
jgi:hypothetical protein